MVKQILELDFAFLVARRVDVGEVVGDDVEIELLGLHPGSRGVKGTDHKRRYEV